MSLFHAVVHIDHHHAQILQFDAEQVQATKLKAHEHDTRQHASGVRSEHEFFGQVCDALAGIREVLVTGSQTALSDFRHYVEKHRPPAALQIVGWESVNHPSENQLVAFARQFFVKHNRMTGIPSA
jgi:stalled ribosome rescue protein Dom34